MASTKKQPLYAGEAPASSSLPVSAGGYAIWEYTDGQWSLVKDACADGYCPGNPPGEPGKFQGQLLRKHGEPVPVPAEAQSGSTRP